MASDLTTLGGGSLLLAWQLKNKHVLIIGGGDVASGRIESVLVADALITIISPNQGLHPLTRRYIQSSHRITYHDRVFAGSGDLIDVDMVLTAVDDVEKSREICDMCRALRIPVNVADIPPSCDFYFGSQIRDGPLQIMISTNGQSPKLANIIKKKIERSLPVNAGEAIARVGELREQLKKRAPGVGGDIGKRRMRWMVDVCTSWEMDDLALLNDDMMKKLLEYGWENNRVPKVEDIGGRRTRTAVGAYWMTSALVPPTLGFIAGAVCTAFLLLSPRR
jgi:precorrin-2 dehydrogenase / sirohydrochlorin ferrochelatase